MKFLYNAPALLHKGALIVGDTHFGMEAKLRKKGVHAGNFSEIIFERLQKLIEETKAKKLILLGDVKENITMVDPITSRIISKLRMLAEVIIVRGNHDGGIEGTGAGIKPSEGFVYENLGLAHGHSWPAKELMQCDYLVCGHQHPMVRVKDSLGKFHSEPVWVIADADPEKIGEHYEKFNPKIKLVLMPAYNPLVGSAINFPSEKQLGPLLNNKLFKLNRALLFRLDGPSLGELKNIGD
ncbi:MAG: metallophosphoesterase [Candidatus Micrarchaeota archaeon]